MNILYVQATYKHKLRKQGKTKGKEDCNLHFTEVLQDLKKKRNHSVKIEYLI